jgi:hypothetical protein
MQCFRFTGALNPQAGQARDQSEWAARHSVVEAAKENVPLDTTDAGEVPAQVDDPDNQGMGGAAWVSDMCAIPIGGMDVTCAPM